MTNSREKALISKRLTYVVPTGNFSETVAAFYQKNEARFRPWEPDREPLFYTSEYQRQLLDGYGRAHCRGSAYHYLLVETQTEELVGSISFTQCTLAPRWSCAVGYKLDKVFVGQGYMTEALSFLLNKFALEERFHRVEALVMPDNVPSIKLLERVGFQLEGHLRDYARIGGEWKDHLLYGWICP